MADDISTVLQSIPGLATAIYDFVRGQNGTDTNNASAVADVADPFRGQRGQYQKQLQGLLTDPSSFTIDPGTQYAIDQGNTAITRAANAQGVTRGGSVLNDIAKNTTGMANQAYNTRIQQLALLSGAQTGSPAAAALATQQGQQNVEKGVGGLGSAIASNAGAISSGIAAFTKWLTSGMQGPMPNPSDDPTEPGGGTGGFGEQPGDDTPLMPVLPDPTDGGGTGGFGETPGDTTPLMPTLPDPSEGIDWGSIFPEGGDTP